MIYHTHDYCGLTSFEHGHDHNFLGITTPAPAGVPHTHIIEGYTTTDDGHSHYYKIQTSINYPAPDGGHFHYIDGQTSIAHQHIHFIQDTTMND